MNEHSSKKILFNKSSLLSLKAELLKKQEEVNEKKRLPQNKLENFKPPPAKAPDKNENPSNKKEKKSFKDSLKSVDVEELEACRKAKAVLEKKAELYEHLSDSAGNSELAGRFLVDFSTKKQDEAIQRDDIPESCHVDDNNDDNNQFDDPDDSEWVEFTDCLGRTRKCHKTDLGLYEKRDKDLMRAMTKDRVDETQPENTDDTSNVEKPLLVQKTNDYLQALREKWEQKENELLAKDKDIHYQDLLFDEARIHGVGYYSFSTDEAERKAQMEELIKTREETLRAQKEAEEKRKKRDELVAARVKAARARQRIRAGLPPEDPKEQSKDFTELLLKFLTEKKHEADAKATEKEKRLKEEQEKERQKLREAYVREWDVGKEGVDDKIKKFREMSQEEYVEQQRDKRIDEFAPPQTSSYNNNFFDAKGRMVSLDGREPVTKTWADVRPKVKTPLPPIISDTGEQSENKGLFFSTADTKRSMLNKHFVGAQEATVTNKLADKTLDIEAPSPPNINKSASKTELNRKLKYKNFIKTQEATPIVNELSDDDDKSSEMDSQNDRTKIETNNTEIAPPPTFDYYGPVPKKAKCVKPFKSDIREAYAQGTKSLENKTTARQLSSRYDFTFD